MVFCCHSSCLHSVSCFFSYGYPLGYDDIKDYLMLIDISLTDIDFLIGVVLLMMYRGKMHENYLAIFPKI